MGFHLAELNIGVLRHPWGDPRIAEFANAIDRVNAIAARSPGFVWRLSDIDMDAAQRDPAGALGGDPRVAATLSVWEDLASLERFVWRTVHKRFFARRKEWFAPDQGIRLALWRTPAGHRPSIDEGVARLRALEADGDTDFAFGWSYAKRLYGDERELLPAEKRLETKP